MTAMIRQSWSPSVRLRALSELWTCCHPSIAYSNSHTQTHTRIVRPFAATRTALGQDLALFRGPAGNAGSIHIGASVRLCAAPRQAEPNRPAGNVACLRTAGRLAQQQVGAVFAVAAASQVHLNDSTRPSGCVSRRRRGHHRRAGSGSAANRARRTIGQSRPLSSAAKFIKRHKSNTGEFN
jgi:hypothetical protein